MNEIQIKKITYQGGFITEESLEKLLAVMEEKGLKLLPREVKDRHVTINFFDDKAIKAANQDPVEVRRSQLIPNEDLGRVVTIKVVAFGEYVEDGIVLNQGLEVSMESLRAVVLSDGRNLADMFNLNKPHITLSLSDTKDENDKFIAKAVNTYKCDFVVPFEMELEVSLEVCKFDVRGTKVLYD